MNSCEIHERPPENGRDCHTELPIIASTIPRSWDSPTEAGQAAWSGLRLRRRAESCVRGEKVVKQSGNWETEMDRLSESGAIAGSREPRTGGGSAAGTDGRTVSKSPEPRAQSPEPRAQSPEPRAESREPRAESREPRAESREPRAESREPRAESREPRAESREPRAESREPRAESREPRAESREPRLYHSPGRQPTAEPMRSAPPA